VHGGAVGPALPHGAQPAEAPLRADRPDRAAEPAEDEVEGGVVAAGQPEHPLAVQEAAGGHRPVARDAGAAAVGGDDHAGVRERADGAPDRRRRGAEPLRQLAHAGQLGSLGELAPADPGGQLGADLPVPGHGRGPYSPGLCEHR
jgi:hypothetical protein